VKNPVASKNRPPLPSRQALAQPAVAKIEWQALTERERLYASGNRKRENSAPKVPRSAREKPALREAGAVVDTSLTYHPTDGPHDRCGSENGLARRAWAPDWPTASCGADRPHFAKFPCYFPC
jgi:hypothetical protein